jgi:hypothetical protein
MHTHTHTYPDSVFALYALRSMSMKLDVKYSFGESTLRISYAQQETRNVAIFPEFEPVFQFGI